MALSMVRVLEMAGKYPYSIYGMILADFGTQVDRMVSDQKAMFEFVNGGK